MIKRNDRKARYRIAQVTALYYRFEVVHQWYYDSELAAVYGTIVKPPEQRKDQAVKIYRIGVDEGNYTTLYALLYRSPNHALYDAGRQDFHASNEGFFQPKGRERMVRPVDTRLKLSARRTCAYRAQAQE